MNIDTTNLYKITPALALELSFGYQKYKVSLVILSALHWNRRFIRRFFYARFSCQAVSQKNRAQKNKTSGANRLHRFVFIGHEKHCLFQTILPSLRSGSQQIFALVRLGTIGMFIGSWFCSVQFDMFTSFLNSGSCNYKRKTVLVKTVSGNNVCTIVTVILQLKEFRTETSCS